MMKKTNFPWYFKVAATILMIATVLPGFCFQVTAAADKIPSDAATFRGHSYKVFNTGKTWDDAKKYCENLGGHLATITSQTEQTFLANLISAGSRNHYWLGATDENDEGNWQWVTGEPWDYSHWAVEQPDNGRGIVGSENYVQIHRIPNPRAPIYEGDWNDILVDASHLEEYDYLGLDNAGFICEWDSRDDIIDNSTSFLYAAGTGGANYESTYYYDDNYFAKSGYEYNHQLATMSLCMAMSAFGRDGVDYAKQGVNGEKDYADYNIRKLMTDIGLKDIDTSLVGTASDNAGYPDEPIEDSIGAAIGHKTMTLHDGSEYTLLAVAVRGGGYKREWGGNFRIGSGINHEGFEIAKNTVLKAINTYVEKYGDAVKANPVKLWFSGYSRGSAVANLSAAHIDKNISSYPWIGTRDNLYSYCFETPAGTTDKEWNSDIYNNIFCWVNPNDFVPKVAMVEWKFHRYGITKFFPTLTSEKTREAYLSKENAMLDKFEQLNQFQRSDYVIDDYKGVNAVDYLIKSKKGELQSIWEGDISKFNLSITNKYPELFPDGIPIPDNIKVIGGGHLLALKYKTVDTPMNEFLDNWVKDIAKGAFENREKYVSDWQNKMIETTSRVLGSGEKLDSDALMESFGSLIEWAAWWHRDSIADLALNYESIIQGHFPELALAWMQSLDSNYHQSAVATGKYRVVRINCPVDVAIYNRAGALVGEIINNVPTDLGGNAILVTVDGDGQKLAYFAADEEYSIELKATADGQMTYSVSEYDQNECNYTRLVNYYDLALKKADVFKGKVESLDQTPNASYPLLSPDGQSLNPSEDLSGSDVVDYRVDVQATVGGTVIGEGTHMRGAFSLVTANADDGYRFDGWYVNDEKVSDELEYRFCVLNDIVLTARFSDETAPGDSTFLDTKIGKIILWALVAGVILFIVTMLIIILRKRSKRRSIG